MPSSGSLVAFAGLSLLLVLVPGPSVMFGAAYLVWLGIQAIRHRRSNASVVENADPPAQSRSLFVDGVVVGVANPKAIVFFAAILPQFVEPGGAPAGVQMLMLGMVFVVVALISDGAWGLAAGTASDWFARSPRRMERMSATGGVVMVGLGLRLALSGRTD